MNLFNKSIAGLTAIALTVSWILPVANVAAQDSWKDNAFYRNSTLNPMVTNVPNVGSLEIMATREQGMAMFARYLENVDLGLTFDATKNCEYTDMANIMNDLRDEIKFACGAGIVKDADSNPMFNPKSNMTAGQFVTVLMRAVLGDETLEVWDANNAAMDPDLMGTAAFNSYKGNELVSKILILEMLRKVDDALAEPVVDCTIDPTMPQCLPSTTGTVNTGTVVEVKAGAFDLAFSATNPAARSVPSQGTVTAASYSFTAGSSDVTLRKIKFLRVGLGEASEIDKVYAEVGGIRVSGKQSVGSDQTATIDFTPALVVKANSSLTVDLIAMINTPTNAGGEHAFKIESAASIDSSAAQLNAAFPVTSNTMRITTYQVARATFESAGSASSVRVGDMNAELGQFRVTNESSDKALNVKGIVLRQDGTGEPSTSLANIKVLRNGVAVSSNVSFNGKYVNISLMDTLNGGSSAIYTIKADIANVENNPTDTYKFSLRYAEDFGIYEANTQFKAVVDNNTTTTDSFSAVNLQTYTAQGGDLVFSRPSDVVTTATVTPGSTDALVLKAKVKANQRINLENLTLNVLTSTGANFGTLTGTFRSFRIEFVSAAGTYSQTFNVGANQSTNVLSFSNTFTVQGDGTIAIYASIRETAAPMDFKLSTLTPNTGSFSTIEYANGGNQVTTAAGSSAGILVTIGSIGMTITRNDSVSNQNVVIGSTNKVVLGFKIKASDVSALNITRLELNNAGDNSFDTLLTNVTLEETTSGSPVSLSTKNMSSNKLLFNDFGTIAIAKNTEKTFLVRADFSTSLATGKVLQLTLSSGGVQGTDSNGISLTGASLASVNLVWPMLTTSPAGTATISANSSSVSNSKLLAANSSETVMWFSVNAQNDDLRLTKVYLSTTGAATATNLNSRISTVKLMEGANVVADGSVFASGIMFDLTDNSNYIVTQNNQKIFTVKVTLNDAALSGQYAASALQFILGTGGIPASALTNVNGISNGLRLVSVNAGTTVTVAWTAAQSLLHTMVRNKPTFVRVGGNTSSSASIIYQFSVTASDQWSVRLSGLVLSTSALGGGTVNLFQGTQATGTPVATGAGWATVTFVLANPVEISASQSQTFTISVTGNTPTPQTTRSVNITDASYLDVFGSDVILKTGIAAYGNVGIQTDSQTFAQ